MSSRPFVGLVNGIFREVDPNRRKMPRVGWQNLMESVARADLGEHIPSRRPSSLKFVLDPRDILRTRGATVE